MPGRLGPEPDRWTPPLAAREGRPVLRKLVEALRMNWWLAPVEILQKVVLAED